jgi:hypothetical protein
MADPTVDQNVQTWFAANPNVSLASAIDTGAQYGLGQSQVENYYNQYGGQTQALPPSPQYSSPPPATPPPPVPVGFSGNAYFAANPDVAAAYQTAPGGLNVDDFAKLHYTTYGAGEQRLADPNAIYNKLVTDAYGGIGRTGIGSDLSNIDQAGLDYYKNQLATGAIKPQDFNSVFGNAVNQFIAANPEDKYTKYVQGYQNTQKENSQIKDYVTSVLGDTTLSAADQVNKILDQARINGYDQTRLENILGKDKVQPLYDTYKKNINDFLTTTLAQEPGTTMNEVGAIHKQVVDHKMTVDDLVKYGGLDKNTAQSYFDMYDKGLGSIVSQLNDSKKYDDVAKTQNLLALQQKYGTTDADVAKAMGGKTTAADIKAYLDPIRNLQTDLQKMMTDNSYTAEDVQKKINEARKDPRASGIYGAALDKISQNMPAFVLRDAQSGNKDLVTSYQDFLTKAKATPETAAKYAPQIAAVEKMIGTAMYSANEVYGGKPQNYQLQIVSPLTEKALKAIPQQLEFGKSTQKTETDDENRTYTYTVPGKVKTPGVERLEDSESGITSGYVSTKPINVNGSEVFAEYDEKGKVTGYRANPLQASWQDGHNYITGKWDAQGNAKPATHGSYNNSNLGGMLRDMGSNPIGMLMLAAATGGLGGLLGGGALGAAGAGGIMAGLQGQDILKGAIGGGLGNLAGGYVGANLPTGGLTDNSMINGYLNSALPKAAGAITNSAITGGNVGQAGLTSLINTGVNSTLNPVFNNLGLESLPTSVQPYASGIGSNLITSSLTGKPVNVQNAVMNTVLQQAMNANKMAARP